MKFAELAPEVCSTAPWISPTEPVWQLTFQCPLCRHRTGVNVAEKLHQGRAVWKIAPTPPVFFNAIHSGGDIAEQTKAAWNGVTIEPSMQDLPHPRQVSCKAHFSVTAGELTFS